MKSHGRVSGSRPPILRSGRVALEFSVPFLSRAALPLGVKTCHPSPSKWLKRCSQADARHTSLVRRVRRLAIQYLTATHLYIGGKARLFGLVRSEKLGPDARVQRCDRGLRARITPVVHGLLRRRASRASHVILFGNVWDDLTSRWLFLEIA